MYAPTYVHHIKSYKQIGTTIKPCIQTFTHIETLALSSTCTQTVTTRDRDSKVLSQIVRVNMKKMGKVAEATDFFLGQKRQNSSSQFRQNAIPCFCLNKAQSSKVILHLGKDATEMLILLSRLIAKTCP